MSEQDNKLAKYCLEHMASSDQLKNLLKSLDETKSRAGTKKELAEKIVDSINGENPIDFVRKKFREQWSAFSEWSPEKIDNIVRVLKGENGDSLKNASWHKASPSSLHRTLQCHARALMDGSKEDGSPKSLSEFLDFGKDIIKQEYLMTARHDLIEDRIVKEFEDLIPEIGKTSLSDFVFAGVPFDLKVTTYKDAWRGKAGNLSKDDKTSLARDYFEDGDKGRTRKEDEDGYGLNRIFVLIKDDNRWLDNPTGKLDELIKQMKEAEKGGPLKVNVKVGKGKEERTIKCLVFEV